MSYKTSNIVIFDDGCVLAEECHGDFYAVSSTSLSLSYSLYRAFCNTFQFNTRDKQEPWEKLGKRFTLFYSVSESRVYGVTMRVEIYCVAAWWIYIYFCVC